MNILIVDDSATMRAGIGRMIERMGHIAIAVRNGAEALERFRLARPDMILLDVQMEHMDGYSVAQEIRALSGNEWVPIIFLSAKEEDQDLERGIEAGGDDYLVKPVSYVVLAAKIRAMQRIDDMRKKLLKLTGELAAANRELEKLSHRDGLTGIANRRFLDTYLLQELSRAKRSRLPLSVLMCDVDHFKNFNDHYGHLAGDECLKRIGVALHSICRRTTDVAARYGGEEFVVVLPATPPAGALMLASSLLETVRALRIVHEYSSAANIVTVSIGTFTCVPDKDMTMAQVLMQADESLYQAKQLGRNRSYMRPDVESGTAPAQSAPGAAISA